MKRVYSSSSSFLYRFSAFRKFGFLIAAVAVGLTGWLLAQDPSRDIPSPPTPITDPAVPNPVPEVLGTGPGEVLTRGPIHEAFAKPVVEATAQPVAVPKDPPAMIEELPPDERPVGENVLWIPGYYAWDEDRLDFIWISGVYRDAPPNHTWVAGYWQKVTNGWQWVPGFWTTVNLDAANQQVQTEVEFLPEPPASIEQGPTTEQPGENHFWVPGNWRYNENRYAWQAGYWTTGQSGWIWVPAHYNWTPQGYVYTTGYWDYSLSQRGLVFAPVFFDAAYYANPVVFRPTVVLRSNFLTVHFWSRPQYAHYYFGDYYGNTYQTAGFRPWFTPLVANRAYYDPIFSYYAWQGRRVDPSWNSTIQQRYEFVMNHPEARPPRTYRDQYRLSQQPQYQQFVNNATIVNTTNTVFDLSTNTTIINNGRGPRQQNFGTEGDVTSLQIQNASMTASLEQVARQQKQVTQAPLQLEKVTPANLDRFSKQGRQFREIAAQRQQLAGQAVTAGATDKGKPRGNSKVRLPVVQPVASVGASGLTPRAGVGVAGSVDPLIPIVPPAEKGKMFPGVGNPTGKNTATNGKQPGPGAAGSELPTDRNPNKLGKNVPPGNAPTGLGNGVLGGGSGDAAIVPLDIATPGTGPVVNNQGNVPGRNGTNANGIPNNATGATNNNPNTTATTVPGQRTPANGAFGQDRGPLVPPGKLAPGQQNPMVFNPTIADPTKAPGTPGASAFNPTIGNPNASTNDNNTSNPTTGTTTNNNPNSTATTVPGQRTPANGAFGQDRGPLAPAGKLAPGQQNPQVFNPTIADPTKAPGTPGAPAFNPRIGNPNSSTNTTSPTNPLGTNPTGNSTKGSGNTTTTDKSGLRAYPPNDQSTLPRGGTLGDKTIPGTNQPYPVLRSGNNPGPDNPTNRGGTLGNKTIPGTNQPYPVLRSGNNPGPDNPANRGGTLGSKTIPGTNQPYPVLKPSTDAPATKNKSGLPLNSKGNPGNNNPVLGNGVSAGPKINPNQPPIGGTIGNKNVPSANPQVPRNFNPSAPKRNQGAPVNPTAPGKQGSGIMPVGPGGGGGGLGGVGSGTPSAVGGKKN